jgi:hypothetical protein
MVSAVFINNCQPDADLHAAMQYDTATETDEEEVNPELAAISSPRATKVTSRLFCIRVGAEPAGEPFMSAAWCFSDICR